MDKVLTSLKEWLKNILRNSWLLFAVVLILAGSLIALRDKYENIRKANERLGVELAHAQIAPSIVRYTIRDTIPVSTAPVVSINRSTYKSDVADKQLLKDLQLRTGQIRSQQEERFSYTDTVQMTGTGPTVLNYSDKWTDLTLRLMPSDTTLVYSVRDSVLTLVYREYKHKFLWWRWGTKGYKVKVVNFNPHATIRYNQYIKVE